MLHKPQVGHFAPLRVASVGFNTWVIKIDFHLQLRRSRFNRLIDLRLAVGVKAAKDILLFNCAITCRNRLVVFSAAWVIGMR